MTDIRAAQRTDSWPVLYITRLTPAAAAAAAGCGGPLDHWQPPCEWVRWTVNRPRTERCCGGRACWDRTVCVSELCRRRRRRSVASVPTVCVDETRAESVGNGLFHGKQSSQFSEAEVRSPKVGLHTALREVESPARLHAKVGRLNRPKKRMCCSFRRLHAACRNFLPTAHSASSYRGTRCWTSH